MNVKKISKFFRAICDEQRLHILTILTAHKTLKVSDIVEKTKISQPTVSHHLKILHEADVVKFQKKGKEIYYSTKPDVIDRCCNTFKDNFCDECS